MFSNFKQKARVLLVASAGLSLAMASAAQAAPERRKAGVAEYPAGAQRPARDVRLGINEGELITLPPGVANIWIANSSIADVYINSNRQVNLYGKTAGETTMFATSASGAVIYAATVRVIQNVSTLDAMLKAAMPNSDIKVAHVGTIAVMTGTVASHEDSSQAEALVKGLLNVQVINRLRTSLPLQVNLQVRFAEVSRSFIKQIGVNFRTADFTNGFQGVIGQGRAMSDAWNGNGISIGPNSLGGASTAVTPGTLGSTLATQGKLFGLNILAALDIGESVGLVSTLSTPNLSAMSGETADFQAGGQFPIPVAQLNGATSIEFKNFGVILSYTPTVMSDGRISLNVKPEISELSSQGAVNVGGFSIPAVTTRRVSTTVELGSGQSFMIAGLMSNNTQNTVQKMPGAADVPILGALFKSTNFQRGETELVIVITPYLVNPVNAADIKLPTDGYNAPNELERILKNVDSNGVSGASRPLPKAAGAPAPDPKVSMMHAPADAVAPALPAAQPKVQRTQTAASIVPKPGFGLD